MTAPAIAPYVATYATRQPYITVDEFLNAPTGVDPSQIKVGASSTENRAALAQQILRASGAADTICQQVLGATTDVQSGQYRVTPNGTIKVPVDYTPLVAVTAVKVGLLANSLATLTDLSGVWPSRKVAEIPVDAANYTVFSDTPAAQARRGRVYAVVTYVNGYANTTLAANALAAATSVTVADGTGIVPGLPLRLYDATADLWEPVTVASTYVFGSTTVPLTSGLVNAHSAGTAISALPPAIKQAVIHLTTFYIKTRGAEAIAMEDFGGEPSHSVSAEAGGIEEYDWALELLEPHKRTW